MNYAKSRALENPQSAYYRKLALSGALTNDVRLKILDPNTGLVHDDTFLSILNRKSIGKVQISAYPSGNYGANIDRLETKTNKEDPILTSRRGHGLSVRDAVLNFIQGLSGRLVVLNAYSSNRREIEFPIAKEINPSK